MGEKSLARLVSATLVALLVAGGVYLFRDRLGLATRDTGSDFVWQGPRQPQPVAKARRSPVAAKGIEDSATNDPVEMGRFVAQMIVEPRVQPAPSDIRPNMSLPEVVKQYGEPDFMASWSNNGGLNQKLIYTDGSALLEVNIRNGHVVSTAN